MITGAVLFSAAVVAGAAVFVRTVRARMRRETFIRAYMFPPGLFVKFAAARPNVDLKQQQLVARGLRQFFLAYLKGGRRRVAMPSQVVDDLWHEFILFTRQYQTFCERAFGGFLHHSPAITLGRTRPDNEGLRRVWWFSCLEENINPRKATRLPLLFALDHKLGIPNGFVYDLDCRRARKDAAADGTAVAGGCGGGTGRQCTSDFSNAGIDGTTDGMGGCGSGGATDGGGSGCSGGCGGGCGGGS
jgi:hypothetical protein